MNGETDTTTDRFRGFLLFVFGVAALLIGWAWLQHGLPSIAKDQPGRADFLRFAALSTLFAVFLLFLWFATKGTVRPAFAAGSPVPAEDAHYRGRLAVMVVGWGAGAVSVVALAAILVFSMGQADRRDTQVMAVLSTVVPVLATWVGTVIAFYFSNESFRQAAESTGALMRSSDEGIRVDAPNIMIPFDKFEKIMLAPEQTLADVSRDTILGKFTEAAITRVVILDSSKCAMRVIRKDFKEGDFASAEAYRAKFDTESSAFVFVDRATTVKRARDLVAVTKAKDVFITEDGQPKQPVIGWLPDDRLRV